MSHKAKKSFQANILETGSKGLRGAHIFGRNKYGRLCWSFIASISRKRIGCQSTAMRYYVVEPNSREDNLEGRDKDDRQLNCCFGRQWWFDHAHHVVYICTEEEEYQAINRTNLPHDTPPPMIDINCRPINQPRALPTRNPNTQISNLINIT